MNKYKYFFKSDNLKESIGNITAKDLKRLLNKSKALSSTINKNMVD